MISKDQDVEFHRKGWGYEKWMANSELYCGKLLVVYGGLRCSVHYHKLKDETFYLNDGLILMRVWEEPYKLPKSRAWHAAKGMAFIGDPPRPNEFLMHPGDRIVIPPNTPHQFLGVDPKSTIIEISTQHFEEDSYRIEKGD
jgi:quercetin dioxygenase-like cupin family protein